MKKRPRASRAKGLFVQQVTIPPTVAINSYEGLYGENPCKDDDKCCHVDHWKDKDGEHWAAHGACKDQNKDCPEGSQCKMHFDDSGKLVPVCLDKKRR